MKIYLLSGICILLFAFIACHKEKTEVFYENKAYSYPGYGTSIVEDYQYAEVSFLIQENLNVHGSAILTDNTIIGNDLNLNSNGRIIVAPSYDTCQIIVYGNTNINDSLFVERGTLIIKGNLNINATGFVNCSPEAQIVIERDLNQAGDLFGLKYFVIYNHRNINNELRVNFLSYEELINNRPPIAKP